MYIYRYAGGVLIRCLNKYYPKGTYYTPIIFSNNHIYKRPTGKEKKIFKKLFSFRKLQKYNNLMGCKPMIYVYKHSHSNTRIITISGEEFGRVFIKWVVA